MHYPLCMINMSWFQQINLASNNIVFVNKKVKKNEITEIRGKHYTESPQANDKIKRINNSCHIPDFEADMFF